LKIVWKSVDEVKAGEICGDDVFDPNSFVLLAHKSAVLDSKTIHYLKDRDVLWVPIREAEEGIREDDLILNIEDEYSKETEPMLAPDLPLIVSDEKYHESLTRFETLTYTFLKNNTFQTNEVVNLSNELVNEVLKSDSNVFNFMTDVASGFIIKHGINTAIVACVLGKAMGVTRNKLLKIAKVALLHDLGLVYAQKNKGLGYVENILDQYSESKHLNRIKIHPILSIKIINKLSPGFLDNVEENAVMEHHERFDGKGFPMGAHGKKINEISRLMAVPDAYDTLITSVDGKSKMDPHTALKWIVSNSKILFDPDVVKAFVQITGLYPTGTVVRLNNGKSGVVISKGGRSIGRPLVLVGDDEVQLEDHSDLFITEVLDVDKMEKNR
jgi:HD-GYP domain-containing protein (c-di-GMP phosphodiesterase class II)